MSKILHLTQVIRKRYKTKCHNFATYPGNTGLYSLFCDRSLTIVKIEAGQGRVWVETVNGSLLNALVIKLLLCGIPVKLDM